MEPVEKTERREELRRKRRRYRTPRLLVYGAVHELTAGGTGHALEPSSGQRPRP